MASPLHNLTKEGVTFEWSDKAQKAFDGIKARLSSAPVLRMPDPSSDEPFRVVCDASLHGTGAVLLQGGQPCAYDSKKFSDAESRYATGDQELLAVVRALTVWRCFLEGVAPRFEMVTDHHPLVFLSSVREPTRRQTRWLQLLSGFDFQWKYEPGRNNVADPLSRHPHVVAVVLKPRAREAPEQHDSAGAPAPVSVAPTAGAPQMLSVDIGDPFHSEVAAAQAADTWLRKKIGRSSMRGTACGTGDKRCISRGDCASGACRNAMMTRMLVTWGCAKQLSCCCGTIGGPQYVVRLMRMWRRVTRANATSLVRHGREVCCSPLRFLRHGGILSPWIG